MKSVNVFIMTREEQTSSFVDLLDPLLGITVFWRDPRNIPEQQGLEIGRV